MKKKKRVSVLYLKNLQRQVKLDAKNLRKRAKLALETSGFSFKSLGIIFLSDRKITYYNREYLRHDRPTDVLSFDLGEGEGEILISAETAAAQARRYRHPLEEEIVTLIIHGILHLAGYDDTDEGGRRAMFRKTEQILRRTKTLALKGKDGRKP